MKQYQNPNQPGEVSRIAKFSARIF